MVNRELYLACKGVQDWLNGHDPISLLTLGSFRSDTANLVRTAVALAGAKDPRAPKALRYAAYKVLQWYLEPEGSHGTFPHSLMEALAKAVKAPEGRLLVRRARSTGTHVALYPSKVFEDSEDGKTHPWCTVCEEHGGVTFHPTRKLAESWMSHPEEWCPVCQGEEDPV